MRRWLVVLGLFALVLVVASRLADRLIASSIERLAESVLGVPTRVDSVRVRPLAGEIVLVDVEIGNPEGFRTPHFARIDRIHVEARYPALWAEPMRVSRIALRGVDLQLERHARGTNYGAILDRTDETSSAPEETEGRMIIESLVVEQVRVALTLRASAQPLAVEIAPISLSDVGTREGGLSRVEVVDLVTRTVLLAVTKHAEGIPRAIVSELDARLTGLMRSRAARDTLERLERGANDLLRGLGDLIPGRR